MSSSHRVQEAVFRPFLFEYGYAGQRWSFEIMAASAEDARERVKALAWARYNGEIYASIPVPNPGILRWMRRFLGRLLA